MLVPLEKILLGLGAAAVILLGILITSNVVARAVFASSVPDSVTLVRELMVAAILLPLAAATANRAHVSVAFVSDRFGPKLRSWLIVLGSVMGMIALGGLIYAKMARTSVVCGRYRGLLAASGRTGDPRCSHDPVRRYCLGRRKPHNRTRC